MYQLKQTAKIFLFVCTTVTAPATIGQQIYKCVKGNQVIFQGTTCDPGHASSTQQTRTTTSRLPWEGLRRGMSSEEVTRIVSGVEKSGDDPRNLRKSGVVVVGIPFNANYNFDSSRQLVSVILENSGDAKVGLLNLGGNEANLITYEKLVAFFRNKYGVEANRSLKSKETGFPGLSANTDWAIGEGKIFVSISPITADTSMLSLGLLLAERAP